MYPLATTPHSNIDSISDHMQGSYHIKGTTDPVIFPKELSVHSAYYNFYKKIKCLHTVYSTYLQKITPGVILIGGLCHYKSLNITSYLLFNPRILHFSTRQPQLLNLDEHVQLAS